MSSLSILIIGGMGPQASLLLHQKIIEQAQAVGARHGHEYPAITHISLPITDFISDPALKRQAVRQINAELKRFGKAKFDQILIACNTAHLLLPSLKLPPGKLVDLPAIAQKQMGLGCVGLLATPVTVASGLYPGHLVTLNSRAQQETTKIIRAVIAGRQDQAPKLKAQIAQLRHLGCSKIVLGCTELSVVAEDIAGEGLINPLQLAAEQVFKEHQNV